VGKELSKRFERHPERKQTGHATDGFPCFGAYSYGFPNGDGDCNCTTWLERLDLPLLTGRMDEFVGLRGISANPSRRFGWCV
jgi:hypothetical protein